MKGLNVYPIFSLPILSTAVYEPLTFEYCVNHSTSVPQL
jgi:hypothetical protein